MEQIARERRKLLTQLLGSLGVESLWADFNREKPAKGRARASQDPPADRHHVRWSGASWQCEDCGGSFKFKHNADKQPCPGTLPAAVRAHASHCQLAALCSKSGGPLLPMVRCTRCGAHGTSRIAHLGQACPA